MVSSYPPASGPDRFFSVLSSLLLFAFLSLLMTFRYSYAVVPLLAGGVALSGLLFVWLQPGHSLRLGRGDVLCLAVLLLFSLLWLADVGRTGKWPVGEGNQGILLPLWPMLAALVLMAWRAFPPKAGFWWAGVALGALLAGGIASYEHWVLGRGRPDNGMNAIPFGNVSLLLATLSLVGLLARLGMRPVKGEWWLRGFYALAVGAGLLAAVLSGTRGSWIVFPALILLVFGVFWRQLHRGGMVALAVLVAVVVLSASFMPRAGVTQRVAQAVENLEEYTEGDTYSSLGIRLEMWRAGARLFHEKPILGWGEGRLEARRDQWVSEGLYDKGISRYDQLHNDLIDTAARRGLVGLVSLLLLYGVPLVLFATHLRRRRDVQGQALALSGVIVVVAFIGFGLTQSLLRDVRGLSGFLGMLTACWCLLKATPEGGGEGARA